MHETRAQKKINNYCDNLTNFQKEYKYKLKQRQSCDNIASNTCFGVNNMRLRGLNEEREGETEKML